MIALVALVAALALLETSVPGDLPAPSLSHASTNPGAPILPMVASPNITVMAKSTGRESGPVGSVVLVNGTGFPGSGAGGPINVTFDGAPVVTDCLSDMSGAFPGTTGTPCAFTVPAAPQGEDGGDNVVANDSVQDNASANFTVVSNLTVSPTQGPGGVAGEAIGTGFASASQITFELGSTMVPFTVCTVGTLSAQVVTTASNGSFACAFALPKTVPPGPSTLTATDALSNSASANFLVTELGLTPAPLQGPVGAKVSVHGTGFSPNSTLQSLTIGGVVISTCTAGGLSTNATGNLSCTFRVPTGLAGDEEIVATDVGGLSTEMVFDVTTLSLTADPSQGPIGASVTVSGTGFSVNTALADLDFDGVSVASCTSGGLTTDSSGAFDCGLAVPSGTSTSSVTATDAGGGSSTATFDVTTPSISLSQGQGPVNTNVTLRGKGFSVSTPLGSLRFDGVAITDCTTGSLTANSTGAISCTILVPSGTDSTAVVATDAGGETASASFTVTVPTISLSPSQGPIGATFWVTGTGFSVMSTLTVSYAGTNLTAKQCSVGAPAGDLEFSDGAGRFVCAFTVPTLAPGAIQLVGTDLATAVVSPSVSFTVTIPAISVSPGRGPPLTNVTINGTGFSPSGPLRALTFDNISLGSTNCTQGSLDVGATGAFSCVIPVPAHTQGTEILATDVGGQNASASFVVTTPAFFATPGRGVVGSTAELNGTGFGASVPYRIGWNATWTLCTGTTSSSGTFGCSFSVPLAPGGPDRLVASSGGLSPNATFTVIAAVSIAPAAGVSGESVALDGNGFDSLATYTVCLQSTASPCTLGSTFNASLAGTIPASTRFIVPIDSAGAYFIDISLSGVLAASAPFTLTVASLQASPNIGPVGSTVTLAGSGFVAGSVYAYCFETGLATCPVGSPTFQSTAGGAVPGGITLLVPPSPNGTYSIDVSSGGTFTTLADFIVVPSVVLNPTTAVAGTTVDLTGTGFDANVPYTVEWDGSRVLCSGNTSVTGNLSCSFLVPSTPAGAYTIVVTGAATAPSLTFTVVASESGTKGTAPFPWWIVAVVVAAALAAVLALLIVRRRRETHPEPSEEELSIGSDAPIEAGPVGGPTSPTAIPLAANPAPAAEPIRAPVPQLRPVTPPATFEPATPAEVLPAAPKFDELIDLLDDLEKDISQRRTKKDDPDAPTDSPP